jgi:hypothetical protein
MVLVVQDRPWTTPDSIKGRSESVPRGTKGSRYRDPLAVPGAEIGRQILPTLRERGAQE